MDRRAVQQQVLPDRQCSARARMSNGCGPSYSSNSRSPRCRVSRSSRPAVRLAAGRDQACGRRFAQCRPARRSARRALWSMRARSSSWGLSSRAGRVRRCGSVRDRPRPAPSRRCPSPPASAARPGARWPRRERCVSSRSELSGELRQRGSRGVQLHAHAKISYHTSIIKLEGAHERSTRFRS